MNLPPIPSPPDIPIIQDTELRDAISAWTMAGDAYRLAFLRVAQGHNVSTTLLEDLDRLRLADAVIQKFIEELRLHETHPGESHDY